MKKKLGRFLVGLVVLLVAVCAVLAVLARPVPDHPFFDDQEGVLVMAHRGGRRLWPENTLYAFEQAVELGVDVLEMDLHSTQDGALVVIHDSTVDRTTNGTGAVQEFTLDELQELDAGYEWTADDGQSFPFRGRGIRIPTLSDVFAEFPAVRMNIEIKQSEPSIVVPLCRLIRDYGKAQQALIASFDAETIEEFRQVCPEVATGAGEDEIRVLYVLSLARLGRVYSPPAEAQQVPEYQGDIHVVTRAFVDAAHGRNVEVHVWTVNEVQDMQRMLDLGVDGIITDYPDRLMGLLGR
jgi:glycerophosphoryl diester phosphodiesterase